MAAIVISIKALRVSNRAADANEQSAQEAAEANRISRDALALAQQVQAAQEASDQTAQQQATERMLESIRRVALEQLGDGGFEIKNGSGGTISRLTIASATHTESGREAANVGVGKIASRDIHYRGDLRYGVAADFQARFIDEHGNPDYLDGDLTVTYPFTDANGQRWSITTGEEPQPVADNGERATR